MNKERSSSVELALSKMGNISFDIDGVIVYSVMDALDVVNKRLKTKYQLKDIKKPFQMTEWLKQDPKVEDPRKEDIELWNSWRVLSKARMIPGAYMVCKMLHNLDHPHLFITSRPAQTRPSTYHWFHKNLPWVTTDQIKMQNNGNEINPDFKVNQIIENSIDLHFEDSLEHAAQIINETEKTRVVLIRHEFTLAREKPHPRLIIPDTKETSLFLSFQKALEAYR